MSMHKETFSCRGCSFILLMLSGSLGLLAGVFNDRIDGVKLIVLLLLLMIPILLGTIVTRGHQCA